MMSHPDLLPAFSIRCHLPPPPKTFLSRTFLSRGHADDKDFLFSCLFCCLKTFSFLPKVTQTSLYTRTHRDYATSMNTCYRRECFCWSALAVCFQASGIELIILWYRDYDIKSCKAVEAGHRWSLGRVVLYRGQNHICCRVKGHMHLPHLRSTLEVWLSGCVSTLMRSLLLEMRFLSNRRPFIFFSSPGEPCYLSVITLLRQRYFWLE